MDSNNAICTFKAHSKKKQAFKHRTEITKYTITKHR